MASLRTPLEIRIRNLEAAGLGLNRGALELKASHPRWKRAFADEAYAIYDALRLENLRLYHIGSTSVPGLAAKPVIDILGSVPSLAEFDEREARLKALGYECLGEYGIAGRRYAVLRHPSAKTSYIHLHLFEHTHAAMDEHLLFRDHLRAHKAAADEYEAFKRTLIAVGTPRERYPEAKGVLVQRLLEEAKRAKKAPHRVLCLLGSAVGGRHTRAFVEELGRGSESFSILDLNERQVGPYVYGGRALTSEDAHTSVMRKMIEADLIQLATPVYWYAMSGVMKDFMDRFSDVMSGPGKTLGEALYGKRLELLATGYDEDLPFGFEVPFAGTAIYFGMDYLGAKYRSVRD